ncbi:MAG: tetratricopeptide repeat protein [Bacteroidetes bacterium]|nr:tetratricopeptide repeat protein [Bacteroidota bacterium]
MYEKALAIDPGNLNIKCDLATCYSNVNKYKRAISLLEENIKMDPLHAKSHHNLAVILKKSGDEKNADKAMQKYNELTRSSAK